MKFHRLAVAVVLIGALAPFSTKAFAQSSTSRLALVIGEAQYRDGPLATAANDGGLMADLLRQAGYDVTGAANLSQDQIRSSFREFLEKVAVAGPRAEVFVYMSGKGVQFAGENYLAPIEASIANSASVPAEAVRLSDFIGPLEGMPAQARVIVLDIARPNNFGRTGEPLASGLAIVDAPQNTLVAFNAAPGTIAPDEQGPYGAYARSLSEMLRQPGLPLNDAFAQVRLRVNEATRGGQTPWNVSKLSASMSLFAPAAGAPAMAPLSRARRPMREVSPQEAYGYAVEADTFAAYNDFLAAYPNDPLARRVRVMLAARREAITWRRTYVANTPDAYWTYLQRYPRGPHAADAARRLAYLSAPIAPPPSFRVYDDYDVPPPPPDEIVIVDRRRFYVNEIVDVPPPRYTNDFLPPIPVIYRDIPPPPPPPPMGFLPIPIPIPIPYARPQGPPGFVVPPRFVQQPVAPPPGGGAAPPPPRMPQGYTPLPPQPPGGPGRPGVPPVPPPGTQPGGNPPGTPPIAPRPGGVPGAPGTMQPGGNPTGAPPSQALPRPGAPGQPPVIQPGGNPTGAPPSAPRPAGPPGSPAVMQPGGNPSGAPPSTTLPKPPGPVGAPERGAPPPVQPGGNPSGAPPSQALPKPAGAPPSTPGAAPSAPRPAPPVAAPPPAPPKPVAPPPSAAPMPRAPVDRGPGASPPREAPVQPRPAPHVEPQRPAAPPPHVDAPRAPPPAMPRPAAPPPPAAMPHPAAPPPAAMPRPSAPPPAAMPHPAGPPPGMPRPAPGGPGGHAPGAPHEGGPGR